LSVVGCQLIDQGLSYDLLLITLRQAECPLSLSHLKAVIELVEMICRT